MTQDIQDSGDIGQIVRDRREQAGLSAAELARRAGTNKTTITRIESGQFHSPRPETLKAIAVALDMPVSDLLTDYLESDDLPSMAPYLRSRYGHLPGSAQAEIATAFRDITARYGYTPESRGPAAGEDET